MLSGYSYVLSGHCFERPFLRLLSRISPTSERLHSECMSMTSYWNNIWRSVENSLRDSLETDPNKQSKICVNLDVGATQNSERDHVIKAVKESLYSMTHRFDLEWMSINLSSAWITSHLHFSLLWKRSKLGKFNHRDCCGNRLTRFSFSDARPFRLNMRRLKHQCLDQL